MSPMAAMHSPNVFSPMGNSPGMPPYGYPPVPRMQNPQWPSPQNSPYYNHTLQRQRSDSWGYNPPQPYNKNPNPANSPVSNVAKERRRRAASESKNVQQNNQITQPPYQEKKSISAPRKYEPPKSPDDLSESGGPEDDLMFEMEADVPSRGPKKSSPQNSKDMRSRSNSNSDDLNSQFASFTLGRGKKTDYGNKRGGYSGNPGKKKGKPIVNSILNIEKEYVPSSRDPNRDSRDGNREQNSHDKFKRT